MSIKTTITDHTGKLEENEEDKLETSISSTAAPAVLPSYKFTWGLHNCCILCGEENDTVITNEKGNDVHICKSCLKSVFDALINSSLYGKMKARRK